MKKTNVMLAIRIDRDLVSRFERRSELHGKNRSEMARYLIQAFVDGRLSLREPPEVKQAREELFQ